MVRVSHRTAALALILLTANLPACAKEEPGGYYWSIQHPDFGARPEDAKHPDEGYYGSIKRDQAKANSDQPGTPVAPAAPSTEAAASAPAEASAPSASSAALASSAPAASPSPANLSQELSTLLAPTAAGTTGGATSPASASGPSASAAAANAAASSATARAPAATAAVNLPPLPGHAAVNHPSDSFQQGLFAYEQKAYHQAEECFQNAVKSDPMSQKAHLWLGLAKYHLCDYDGARDELNLAFRLNPFTEEGRQARETLLSVAQTVQKLNSEPVDPPWLVQQTLRITARQARGLQAQKIAEGNQTAAWRTAVAQRTAARLTGQTNWYLQGMAGYNAYNNWSAQQEISNANFIRTHYIMTDSQVQGAMARKDGIDRANNIQQSVNGFFDLLGQKPHDGTPRVRAFGSNLYVRYYGKESIDGPPTVAPEDPPIKAVTMHYNKLKPSYPQPE